MYLDDNYEILSRPELTNSLKNQMVAMGKALVCAKKTMSLEERKLLVMTLTKIKWNSGQNNLDIEIAKDEIQEAMEWSNVTLKCELRPMAKRLATHSWIEFGDSVIWEDGFLVTNARSTRNTVIITLNEKYRALLEELTKDKDFITIWANDVYKFNSIYAYLLYEDLRLHSDTRHTNWRTYSTKQLKELFGIPKTGKGSYMHKDVNGKLVFDRTNFEKKVLWVALKELSTSEMIDIKYFHECEASEKKPYAIYAKIKKNGYVAGYQFKYDILSRQKPTDKYIAAEAEDEQLDGQMSIDDYIN